MFVIVCPLAGTLADAGDRDGGGGIVGLNQLIPHRKGGGWITQLGFLRIIWFLSPSKRRD